MYVSGTLGRVFDEKRSNLDAPGATGLIKLGLIVSRECHSGDILQLSSGFYSFLGLGLRHGLTKCTSICPGNHSNPSAFAS